MGTRKWDGAHGHEGTIRRCAVQGIRGYVSYN